MSVQEQLTQLDEKAQEILGLYEYKRAATLPLLWLVQGNLGYIPQEAEHWVGALTEQAASHVHEVVTFYTMYSTQLLGKQHIQVCNSLPCQLKGSKQLISELEKRLDIKCGETSADGKYTLSAVECLCSCETAPVVQVNDTYVDHVEGQVVDDLVAHVKNKTDELFEGPGPKTYVETNGPVLSKHFGNADGTWFDAYVADGGYEATKKVLTSMKPDEVIEETLKANLRGLGGAGFPTGRKWSFIPKETDKPKFLVVNADEGEPGTIKDRYILERDPHALLEGMIIAAYAIGAHKAYLYIRGEYVRPMQRFQQAVDEAYAKGWLGKDIQGTGFDLDVVVHRGAGAYICGEETALLSSLEGGKGFPKLKPPFPAIEGLFKCPTIVNNVETLACVRHIFANSAEWFAGIGTEKQGGTRLFSLSGHVNRPGVYEAPVSVTLKELIESEQYGQGVKDGKQLKAVVPGGISAKILKADEVDVAMDFDSLMGVGTMAGSAGVIVMDESVSMVEALHSASHFFADESCGQCSPCREGTGWLLRIINRVLAGEAESRDLDNMLKIAGSMEGKTICVFADAAAWPVQSYITKFREEFEDYVKQNGMVANHASQPMTV